MQNFIISQNNINGLHARSITELETGEMSRIYGGIGATARHFAFGTTSWGILMGVHGLPSSGFAAAALATPAVFATIDAIHHWSLTNAMSTYAKKFDFGGLMCLTLGVILKLFPNSNHITNNVFTGFNISNPD